MPICSVLDCDEVYLTRDNVRSVYSFFSFPRDDHLCAEWIRRIGRDPQTFSPTFARVCSKHFEDSQLTLTATGNRPAKRKDCVPTLHLPLTNSRGVPINLAAENDDQLQMIINIIRNKPPQSRVYKKRPSSTSLAFSKPYNGINSIVLIQDRGLNIKEEIDEDAGINPFNESIEDLPSIIKSEPTQCRLCLAETNPCVSIFDEFHSVSNSSTTTMTVIDAISKLISLQIPSDDLSLPTVICAMCYGMMGQIYEFRLRCQSSQIKLNEKPKSPSVAGAQIIPIKLNKVDQKDSRLVGGNPFQTYDDNDDDHESGHNESRGVFDDSNLSQNDDDDDEDMDEKPRVLHKNRTGNPRQSNHASDLTFPCYKCGQMFPMMKLQYHLNVHNKIRPFVCPEKNCTITFSSPHALNVHMKRLHRKSYSTKTSDLSKLVIQSCE